ncbi:Hsp70 family protein [Luteimonas sp. MC1572]|uniref:Hsp70 family protein n=1 Tax=Luteimonas sp. MC1572 TaxID=2799325 RepID=UPI0018F0DB7C|nr:Hsp70 family protein [Luteimonas sp. MC1572]MBJ6982028.1 Hsp70 family protein [Luteimonas sp. MC1572]QQO03326.1 Hsp70 family protein [Luteimonas sp. MC1572]
MRIGIDFGTSYSAAGAVVDGEVQLIRFGDQAQFRTTAFFPQRLPDIHHFELTDALQDEVTRWMTSARADQTREIARLERLRQSAMALPVHQRDAALAQVPTMRRRGDDELRRAAIAAVRRDWVAGEVRQAMDARADLDDALYGDEAVDAFLAAGEGHLVVSPKSMLGYKLESHARDVLLGIATHVLRHIRTTASAQLGTDVHSAVMGRPVRFRSSMEEAGGVQALEILTDAAHAAGFEAVEFLEEPAAAAYDFHRRSARACRTMILDIGGGTTDMALALVGGDAPAPVIHGAWGEPVGGTDVDLELSMRGVMPLFGKNVTRTAVHRYYEASHVQDLQRQANFHKAIFDEVEAPYGARLMALQQAGNTVRLNRAVERAKIELSGVEQVTVDLDYIEAGLACDIDRTHLAAAAERPFLAQLRALLREASAGAIEAPEVVYLTGGMSRSPYVPALVGEVFPGVEIVRGDASLGVVTGLARAAAAAAD